MPSPAEIVYIEGDLLDLAEDHICRSDIGLSTLEFAAQEEGIGGGLSRVLI